MSFRYRAFGLEIASAIAMPALAPANSESVDVTVDVGPVSPEEAADAFRFRSWVARPGRLVLDIPGLARFEIVDGARIRIAPFTGVEPEDCAAHVQGSAMAALLQQRSVLPLHAASIETDRGAVLVTGSSGVGKSTLLAGLLEHGFRLLCDDVTAARIDARGEVHAVPAFPAMRIWRDSAEHFGHDVARLRQVRGELEKYYVPVARFRDEPQKIHAVVFLRSPHQTLAGLRKLPDPDRTSELVRCGFRKNYLVGLGKRDLQFRTVAALDRQARLFVLRRPPQGSTPEDLAAQLAEGLGIAPGETIPA